MTFDLIDSLQRGYANPDHFLKALNLVPRPEGVRSPPCYRRSPLCPADSPERTCLPCHSKHRTDAPAVASLPLAAPPTCLHSRQSQNGGPGTGPRHGSGSLQRQWPDGGVERPTGGLTSGTHLQRGPDGGGGRRTPNAVRLLHLSGVKNQVSGQSTRNGRPSSGHAKEHLCSAVKVWCPPASSHN